MSSSTAWRPSNGWPRSRGATAPATSTAPPTVSCAAAPRAADPYPDACHSRGGLLRMYYDISWYGTRMIAWGAMPPDPDYAAGDWAAVWDQHISQNEPYLLEWLRPQGEG